MGGFNVWKEEWWIGNHAERSEDDTIYGVAHTITVTRYLGVERERGRKVVVALDGGDGGRQEAVNLRSMLNGGGAASSAVCGTKSKGCVQCGELNLVQFETSSVFFALTAIGQDSVLFAVCHEGR